MKKKRYRIMVWGSKNDTYAVMELNARELKLMQAFVEQANKNTEKYRPTLRCLYLNEIKPYDQFFQF
jgi:hypothetical protein